MHPASANAAQCGIMRVYLDHLELNQHMSFEKLEGQAANSKTSCKAACDKEASYVPAGDAALIVRKGGVRHVDIKCTYQSSTKNSGIPVITKYRAPATQMRVKKAASSSRSGSKVTRTKSGTTSSTTRQTTTKAPAARQTQTKTQSNTVRQTTPSSQPRINIYEQYQTNQPSSSSSSGSYDSRTRKPYSDPYMRRPTVPTTPRRY